MPKGRVDNVAIKDASSLSIFKKNSDGTKDLAAYFDFANTFNLSLSSESIYATAKGANKIAFDGIPEGTVEFEAEVLTEELLACKLGQEIVTANKELAKREVVVVDATDTVVITGTPVAGTVSAFILHPDSSVEHKEKCEFTYDEATKTLTFTNAVEGDKVAVYYLEEATDVKVLTLGLGKKEVYEIHANVLAKNTAGEDCFINIILDKCSAQLNVELSLEAENPSSVTTTFELLANDDGDFGSIVFI